MAEAKGDDLMSKADKKAKSFSLFGGGNKYEDSAELYTNAAAQYKIAKAWEKAGDAYLQAAEMLKIAKDESGATENYANAAQAYRKVDPVEALRVYNLAATMHMEQNHFSTAAKLYKNIAELSEEDRNYQGAIDAYSKAADCYEAEDQKTSRSQSLLKIAHYSAMLEDYKKAIDIYEEVALASLDNQLLAWGAKEHYFKAMLCQFVLAVKSSSANHKFDDAENALEKYKSNYPAFEGSRECKMVEQCLAALKEGEVEKFQDAIVDFDTFSKLDDWKAGLLIQVKNKMKEAPAADMNADLLI
jgi:alpha-soluble NSF attachment protein